MAEILNKRISYLYKYRSLANKEYILDIFKNHRLYFPTRSKLNDPLEGVIQPIHFHTLGSSLFIENGYLQPEFNELLEEYRIIEKSSEAFFYFPSDSIEEVILGNILEIDRETVIELAKICNEQNIKLRYVTFCTDYFEIKKEPFCLSSYLNGEYNPYISNDAIIYNGQKYPIRTHIVGSARLIERRE